MNFTCDKTNLQEAISIAQKAVTGKSTMPILQGLLLNARGNKLTINSSDIDLGIETKCNANIKEEGSIVVDSKLFGDIIRKLPNSEIQIKSISEGTIEITCQRSRFTLVHMKADEFPQLPYIDEDEIISIPQKLIKNMIRSTIFAIAIDETRPILTGILFEIKNRTLNLVALDGFRLALKKETIDTEQEFSAVIPGKTLHEVVKILEDEGDVDITFTTNHILFNLGETKVVSRLLEGEFIKYQAIIPEEHELSISVNRASLLNSIERASLVSKDASSNLIKFNISEDNIVITSNSQLGDVREEVSIKLLKGNELQIAFNSKYLIDALKIMEEETITLQFTSAVSPCIIKNIENDNVIYLVLPVRISNS
ncbi:DNA polymerase III subunit beta [Clostridium cellulovorans]|uniref:Beta sliding clamp n=1 Tax=Clostridium cellulovorans (strain ATCC 35296 / DSM 3052 / OCM 3 / 743B) TaxID=573061 RepID=D9SMK8_CLOC7|nr:DNA polymerase III subunit beta [Clostridium cellulovorans]ADL49793.1 DNA polymerase III, beta subunit [Clostridium cellulovorans 743B]